MTSQTTRVFAVADANGWQTTIRSIPISKRGAKWPEDFHQPSHVATFERDGDDTITMALTPHARFSDVSTEAAKPLQPSKIDD